MTFTGAIISIFAILIIKDVLANVTISSNDINHLQREFECEITDEILSVVCKITIFVNYDLGVVGGCFEFQKNSLKVVLDRGTVLTSFVCTSVNSFTINFDFGNEKPRLEFTKFQRERVSPDFFNPESYLFKIKMIVPSNQIYDFQTDRRASWFTYTILSLGQPLKTSSMKIRFVLRSSAYYSGLRDNKRNYFSIMPSEMTILHVIHVKESTVQVPCASTNKISLFLLEEITHNGTCPDSESKIKLSNSSLSHWSTMEGFTVNISSLWNRNGTLVCVGEDVEKDPSKWIPGSNCISFGLQFPPSLQIYPNEHLIRYKPSLVVSESSLLKPDNVRLMCSSTKWNVTMNLRYSYKEEINLIPTHHEVNDPEHRYVTEMKISYFVLKNIRKKMHSLRNDFFVDCVESSNTSKKLFTWSFYKSPFDASLTYEPRLNKFICNGSAVGHVPLIQIECDDIYECHMWGKSLQNKKTWECSDDQIIPFLKGTPCYLQPIDGVINRNKFCMSVSPVQKAVVQCFEQGDEPINILYFKGFDGKIHTLSNVSTEAIINFQCYNQESYVIFKQYMTCHCEGHSFFHAHGIKWLVVFNNGSTEVLPKHMVTYKPLDESRDEYNPLSVVAILFKLRDIKSIICAVPLLKSKQWQNVSQNIQVLDGMAPKIFSFESKKEIAVGEKGQSLSCASEGRPTPRVEWSQNSKKIQAPLIVISQGNSKLLIFPDYNNKFEGKYLCLASNSYGNDTKSFVVTTRTYSSDEMGSVSILTIGVIIAIIIILSILYLIQRLRASRKLVARLTELEIDEFFKGTERQQPVDDPFALPYNAKYELVKDSFEIDKKQFLGSGQFGTVYRGKIYGQEGEFAFKTTRNVCTPEILRGMLSELKIMMYVGTHKNIIKLVGAYTQELQAGLLYIATELCVMGSLHSHLRNIKQDVEDEGIDFHKTELFSKCLRWSEEIANGMDYLSIKQVVHSDLAARNILLTEVEVAKIADFGLSRRMYNYCDYKKTDKTNPLPWKWMAIESLRDMTFSTQSDIWAYGVTLWEIFSLGGVPYPGISWTIEFVDMLDQGLRNLKPKYATVTLHKIMLSCWDKNPTNRPEFGALRYFFMDYKDEDLNREVNSLNEEDMYMDIATL